MLSLGFEYKQFIMEMMPENIDREIGTSNREGKEVKNNTQVTCMVGKCGAITKTEKTR